MRGGSAPAIPFRCGRGAVDGRMSYRIETLSDLERAPFDTIIDVRSPAEFAEDHIPGAINLPALSNEERAQVGTIYVQESPFRARKIGAALVARNVAAHLEVALADREGGWQPLVYCWRGGQRSGSVATILRAVGWRTETVEGGYQSYRRAVVSALYDRPIKHRLVVIDGNTGTGKTDILTVLRENGAQVVDLEGIGRHRGSLLGGRPGGQPSQKAFESAIAMTLASFDPVAPVFVEAESSKVGNLIVPPTLWSAMSAAPRIEIAAPPEVRAAYLARAYAELAEDIGELVSLLEKMIPLQGRERVSGWQAMARAGAFKDLALALCEAHYDPRYAKSRARFDVDRVACLDAERLDPDEISKLAEDVLKAAESLAEPQ